MATIVSDLQILIYLFSLDAAIIIFFNQRQMKMNI